MHRLWPVHDLATVSTLAGLVGPKPLFIADGHHRYETACNYRDELIKANGPLAPSHPANFVLMMFIGMNDPGLLVLPTHRLFRGLPEMTSDELIEKLGDSFTTRLAGEGSDLAGKCLGGDRNRRRPRNAGALYTQGRTLGAGQNHAGRPGSHGRSRSGAQRRLARPGRVASCIGW